MLEEYDVREEPELYVVFLFVVCLSLSDVVFLCVVLVLYDEVDVLFAEAVVVVLCFEVLFVEEVLYVEKE